MKAGYKALRKKGIQPRDSHSVIDTGAGKSFQSTTTDMVPTLTASRCKSRAYWLTSVPALSDLTLLAMMNHIES